MAKLRDDGRGGRWLVSMTLISVAFQARMTSLTAGSDLRAAPGVSGTAALAAFAWVVPGACHGPCGAETVQTWDPPLGSRSAIKGHHPQRADRAPGRCRAGEGLAWR